MKLCHYETNGETMRVCVVGDDEVDDDHKIALDLVVSDHPVLYEALGDLSEVIIAVSTLALVRAIGDVAAPEAAGISLPCRICGTAVPAPYGASPIAIRCAAHGESVSQ